MASRFKPSKTRPSSSAWHKVEVNKLAELLASRTGLDEADIHEALQELQDTDIYVKSPKKLAGMAGWFGKRRRKS